MTDMLDFHPQKIRTEDFSHAPGSGVEGTFFGRYTVVDREGFAFLACCTFHERAGVASGWYPVTEKGRPLANLTAMPILPPFRCDRETNA